MKWAGHTVRMKDERSPKISETKNQRGCRKCGRPRLRSADCRKRGLRKADDEEKWREKANNDAMEEVTKLAIQRSDK